MEIYDVVKKLIGEREMQIYDVVKKVIGEIDPVGETNLDEKRFDNLRAMAALIGRLLSDMDDVFYQNKDRQEYSMKRASVFVNKFFDEIGIEKIAVYERCVEVKENENDD